MLKSLKSEHFFLRPFEFGVSLIAHEWRAETFIGGGDDAVDGASHIIVLNSLTECTNEASNRF